MHKKAFTMIELVFVIVVLGILAAMAIPRMDRDLRQEAADNILSAIRYTQHLALVDDKQKFDDPRWQQKFWKIQFTASATDTFSNFYTISSDIDYDQTVDKNETARDPANGKYMYNTSGATSAIDNDESPNIFIGKKYGVDTIAPNGGCTLQTIAFDHLGRPYSASFSNSTQPNNSGYMTSDCTFTFSSTNNTFTPFSIIIRKETGYAQIVGQPDS